MSRILLTAFGPYGPWKDNASWLALVELTRALPDRHQVTTRRYPVDFEEVHKCLARDLQGNFDVALLLGQAPGSTRIRLEAVGLNVATQLDGAVRTSSHSLIEDGPLGYRTHLPIERWADRLIDSGIPCGVSYHAGTYVCNAAFYLTHYLIEQQQLPTRAAFIHLPLETSQAAEQPDDIAALPRQTTAEALRLILEEV